MAAGLAGREGSRRGFTAVHWLAVVLAVATGVIHLYLYWYEGFLPFLLGGIGYLGAVVLLFVAGRYRPVVYLLGVPFVLVHLVGWYMAGMPSGGWELAGAPFVTLGTVDKAIEVVLLVSLLYLYRIDTRVSAPGLAREARE